MNQFNYYPEIFTSDFILNETFYVKLAEYGWTGH